MNVKASDQGQKSKARLYTEAHMTLGATVLEWNERFPELPFEEYIIREMAGNMIRKMPIDVIKKMFSVTINNPLDRLSEDRRKEIRSWDPLRVLDKEVTITLKIII